MSKPLTPIVLSILLLWSAGSVAAGSKSSKLAVPPPPPPVSTAPSYSDIMLTKLGSGFANLATGLVEIPKNMINTANGSSQGGYSMNTNRSGELLFGLTGGALKGVLHSVGRTASGMIDVATFFVPTKPTTNPPFVWQNFYTDTQYGPFFKVDGSAIPTR